jgi:hypothetical protein
LIFDIYSGRELFASMGLIEAYFGSVVAFVDNSR